ncbi:AraC family transcriptional regulator [Francisella adeliensis]|nr:helix-turn-helix transcriptional regulator [Francisella adeliensis]MBK2085786.1 helix-turn-helix domain-containing protein [Francisella adeliensis]MBK2097664.1 helix-turn-helix domain-containing protein [Francisella adeliensis]
MLKRQIETLTLDFDSDKYEQKLISLQSAEKNYEEKSTFHKHFKGQLIMPIKGVVKTTIDNSIWVASPGNAIWIPSQIYHDNLTAPNSEVYMLFINPSLCKVFQNACTLSISPLIRELIMFLSKQPLDELFNKTNDQAVDLLIDQLSKMKVEFYNFPLPNDKTLRSIAEKWLDNPTDRRPISYWANENAMSEKTLSRKVKQEIGLTFDQWKKQLYIVLAMQKLNDGTSIQLISEDLGYESVSAFIVFFKNALGCTPKKYIKILKGNK